MLKKLCLLFTWILLGLNSSQAQFVKEYKVTEKKGFEMVNLDFSSYKSYVNLKRNVVQDPIYIHGHLAQSNILPEFSQSVSKGVLSASLVHKNIESDNLGKSITSKLFFSGDGYDHTWDVGLSSNYLYALNFSLGMGKSEMDLSQIPVSKLIVRSASSDVSIFYSQNSPNSVAMDTLLVTLSMGTLEIDRANFTNAKQMIFEVDYGKIDLNFSDGLPQACQVISAVSVGSVHLVLPPEDVPVRIKMRTTPMCRTSMPKYLKSTEKGVYVSKGYRSSNPKLLDLIIDVGVGSVTVE
ncbi:hypothetical protein DFQ04_2263 [Algoriphagus boseongensis]|uniref:Adhesin domain-containing protein n=1 Tax=Algoriphagus boseongensis TaxID=1442587 RepID=A0A4R6T9Q5_9BACT|nr:hypothetical protein [Algoriphagus boseongensis]TDQ17607.1 hypothetical protein DFQ04_2263 [Algoriphagus boseongensis]